jgi:hypothetical protein
MIEQMRIREGKAPPTINHRQFLPVAVTSCGTPRVNVFFPLDGRLWESAATGTPSPAGIVKVPRRVPSPSNRTAPLHPLAAVIRQGGSVFQNGDRPTVWMGQSVFESPAISRQSLTAPTSNRSFAKTRTISQPLHQCLQWLARTPRNCKSSRDISFRLIRYEPNPVCLDRFGC